MTSVLGRVEQVLRLHRAENGGAWCTCGWHRHGVGFPDRQFAAHVADVLDRGGLLAEDEPDERS